MLCCTCPLAGATFIFVRESPQLAEFSLPNGSSQTKTGRFCVLPLFVVTRRRNRSRFAFGELAQNGTKVQHKKTPLGRGLNGGRDRDRTDDLLVANEALSQLSYTPDKSVYGTAVTRTYLL